MNYEDTRSMSEISGLYKITNKLNGKSYIGKSKNIKYRFEQHTEWKNATCSQYIGRAIKKYGSDNFDYVVLLEHPDNEDLCYLEIEYITEHKTLYPYGYNLAAGGKGGASVYSVDETREKHKLAVNQPEEKLRKSNTSKKMWSENYDHMKQAIKSSRNTEESKAKTSAQAKAQWSNAEFHRKMTEKSHSCFWCGAETNIIWYSARHGDNCKYSPTNNYGYTYKEVSYAEDSD